MSLIVWYAEGDYHCLLGRRGFMSRTRGLKAFLASLCLSALAIDSAAAQDAPVSPTEPAITSPSVDTTKPSWLLGRQKGVVNPFRATPAPGTPGALQKEQLEGSTREAPGLARARAALNAPDPVAGAPAAGSAAGCPIGFRRAAAGCVALQIPENGTIDLTGHAWTCKRGFYRQQAACLPVPVPENASLDNTGNRWVCNPGFRRQQQTCVAFAVPANASLDASGRTWICNAGFERREQACIDAETARLQRQADRVVNARPGAAQAASPRDVTITSGENRQGRSSRAKVVIGRF